jgi:hypothetical protein
MFKTCQSMVSISDSAERLFHVKSEKRWEASLLQAKRSDSDASHDLSNSHLEDRSWNSFMRIVDYTRWKVEPIAGRKRV